MWIIESTTREKIANHMCEHPYNKEGKFLNLRHYRPSDLDSRGEIARVKEENAVSLAIALSQVCSLQSSLNSWLSLLNSWYSDTSYKSSWGRKCCFHGNCILPSLRENQRKNNLTTKISYRLDPSPIYSPLPIYVLPHSVYRNWIRSPFGAKKTVQVQS